MVSTRLMTISTGPCNSEETLIAHPQASSSSTSVSQTRNTNGSPSTSVASIVLNSLVSNGGINSIDGDGFIHLSGSGGDGSALPSPNTTQNQLLILDLPIEILDKIFSYVGYKKTAQLRVVSRQMNTVCSGILNSTFQRLQNMLLNRFQTVKNMMPRRESARRNHPLACECDIVETCHMRLSLLQMTFGKHIERKHCCFFPGGILDEVYHVLNFIRTTPKLVRPFKATDELFDLSTMAMEYFKDYIEPNLPEIGYFSNPKPKNYLLETKSTLSAVRESSSNSIPSPPQSNMVLRKGIRKIKQGMKRYNNQLSVLRNELRTCKRKANEQSKQISEQQKLLSEQQKQTVEYANRLDENDKKNEEMSRKFSTLLQELNKCKTELQYWRSKSPATPTCTSCGQTIAVVPPEEMQALVNQGVKPEDLSLESPNGVPYAGDFDEDELSGNSMEVVVVGTNGSSGEVRTDEVQNWDGNGLALLGGNDVSPALVTMGPPSSAQMVPSIASVGGGMATTVSVITSSSSTSSSFSSSLSSSSSLMSTATQSLIGNATKRKANDDGGAALGLGLIEHNKKMRRVQSKSGGGGGLGGLNGGTSRCQSAGINGAIGNVNGKGRK